MRSRDFGEARLRTYGGIATCLLAIGTAAAAGIPQAALAAAVPRALVASVSLSFKPASPVTYGTRVRISAAVSGSGPAPTGTLEFTANGSLIAGCSAVKVITHPRGKTACNTASLPIGSDTIVAYYSGDSNYAAASSPSTAYVVTGSLPSISFTATPPTASPLGTTVTLRAAVSGTRGTPTGTVAFQANGLDISGCSAVTVDLSGDAVCATSVLPLGTDSLSVLYSGDSTYTSVSSSMTYTVTKLSPTVQLTASPTSNDPAGGTVVLTAAVSGSAGTPTGTVNFESNGSSILTCSSVAIWSSQAQCTTTSLVAGTDSLSALYSGDGTYLPGSGNLTYVVGRATPAVYLSATPGSTPGRYVITAVVVGAAGIATGTIDFEQGSSTIAGCGSIALSGGAASCTTSTLTAGPNTLTALYSGGGSYSPAQATITFDVSLATPQVDLTAVPPAGDTAGDTVTLNVAVTSPVGSPTGTVGFQANGEDITGCSSVAVDTTGNARCTTSALAVGTDEVAAVYSGDSNNNPNSDSMAYAVGQAVSVVTLGVSPGSTSGQYVLTATASGAAGVPTGVMDFEAGGTDITGCAAVALGSSGVAICTTSFLLPGANELSASYSGNASYVAGQASISFKTELATPTVTVSATPAGGASVGALVTLSARAAGSSVTPTGTVDFESNTVTVPGCGAVVLDTTGTATCTTSALPTGSDDVVAVYSGDSKFNLSSGSLVYPVAKSTPAVYLSVAAGAMAGQHVLTAVTVGSAGVPTGTVEFEQSGNVISGCSASALDSSGAATCTTSGLLSGAKQLAAVYSGDQTYTSATDTITFDIAFGNTQLTLTGAPLTGDTFGHSVTLTATVSPPSGAPTETPTGTVAFQSGGVGIIGCGARTVSSRGTATCTTSKLDVGASVLEAVYSGDGNNNPATGSLAYEVGRATPRVSLRAAKAAGDVLGEAVTLATTVSGVGGVPTGDVSFVSGKAPISGCTTVRLSLTGVATCRTKALGAGTDDLKVMYSGDAFYVTGSATLGYRVAKAVPLVRLRSVPGSRGVEGAIVTFTVTLAGPLARPTGSVAFADGRVAVTGCRRIVVSRGTATCRTETLGLGRHSITARYLGDGDYLARATKIAYTVIIGGYWVASSTGATRAYGPVATPGGARLGCSTVATVSAVDKDGYWLVCSNGRVTSRGAAPHLRGVHASHVIAATATPDGKGLWLLSSTGAIYRIGDAPALKLSHKGSAAPVVAIASTLDGRGLWVAHADGSITRYGDAKSLRFTGRHKLNGVICGIVTAPTGQGYGLVAKDGGVFGFGTFRFFGSLASRHLPSAIVSMALMPLGNGYLLVSRNGTVYAFGADHAQRVRSGSLSGRVVGIAIED